MGGFLRLIPEIVVEREIVVRHDQPQGSVNRET
jgi:hypothetical protein